MRQLDWSKVRLRLSGQCLHLAPRRYQSFEVVRVVGLEPTLLSELDFESG